MATRKSSISAELVIDRRKFKSALDASRGDARAFASSLEAIKAPRRGALSAEAGQGAAGSLNSTLVAASRLTAAVVAVKAAGAGINKVLDANAWYGDLKDKMTAVSGDADEAARHLGVLFAIGREQSMTKEQLDVLVSMSERLQSQGHSAERAADFLRELANTAEATGDSIEDTAGVVMAIDRIGESGEASLRKLMALSAEMPGIRNVIKDAFGTDSAAELEKFHLTSVQLFDGLLASMKKMKTALPSAAEKGLGGWAADWFEANQSLEGAMGADSSDQVNLSARVPGGESAAERSARINAMRARVKAEEDAEAAKKKANTDAASAAEDAKKEKKKAAEEKAEAEKEAAEKKFLADAAAQEEVARLRSRGKNKQADKLEKDLAEQARVEQFMTEGNLSESAARALAKGERRTAEDEEFRSRTGRNRIHGAVSDNKYYGIDDRKMSDRAMGMSDEWTFGKLDAMKADRRNRPLKSQRDREDGKASINPDRFSGMTIKQAEDMLEVLRAIKAATENNSPTTADKTRPR